MLAADLYETGLMTAYHRLAEQHRFHYRQTESFKQGREDECLAMTIQPYFLPLADQSQQMYVRQTALRDLFAYLIRIRRTVISGYIQMLIRHMLHHAKQHVEVLLGFQFTYGE